MDIVFVSFSAHWFIHFDDYSDKMDDDMVDLKKSCYLCCFLFAVVDNVIGSGIELDFRET